MCADLTAFAPGRHLDDNANLLIRYEGGARGVMIVSQVCAGEENALSIKVYGTEAGIESRQEEPNYLYYGARSTEARCKARQRLPLRGVQEGIQAAPGYLEAFIEAFANVYMSVAATICAKQEGAEPGTLPRDFPNVYDGARGVHFIEKTVESGRSSKNGRALRGEPRDERMNPCNAHSGSFTPLSARVCDRTSSTGELIKQALRSRHRLINQCSCWELSPVLLTPL